MRQTSRLAATVLAALAVAAAAAPVRGVEPAREFLEALRTEGYNDLALIYLDQMRNSPLAPVELKEVLDYERGVTLVKASQSQRDIAIREKQLDEANVALQQFIQQRPNHRLVDNAQSELGNLLVERARIKVERSKKGNATPLLADARKLYDQAFDIFGKQVDDIRERLKKLGAPDPNNQAQRELVEGLRKDYLYAWLLQAAVREETADVLTKDSADYKKVLEEADDLYGKIYENHRALIAGLYAQMYRGRVQQKLSKHKDAINFFIELLEQPDNPDEFREVKTKTLKMVESSWRSEGHFAEAIRQFREWVEKARPNEERNADYMELRMLLANLEIDYSKQLESKNSKDENVRLNLNDAKKQLQFVAKYPNDLQQDARKLLAEIGGGPEVADDRPEPKTFDEARVAGREMLGAMQTAEQVLKLLPPKIAAEKDGAEKAKLQAQLDESQKAVVESRSEAMRYFDLALRLADVETPTDDINTVLYFQCYLHFVQENYYEAAVLGEFVARRSPSSAAARQCAKIAMASYLKIYAYPEDEDKSFESGQIISICDYITKQWSDQPEAVDALNTLIPFMIKNGELTRALQYLKDIPEDAPQRGAAELKTGQALWSNYLTGSKELRDWKADPTSAPAGVDLAAKEADLATFKEQAALILAAGVGRMQKAASLDDIGATAILSLVQIYVDAEQAPKAIELIEQPQLGLLALVDAKHPATQKPGYTAEAYKTSLRAYIAALATPGVDADAMVQKATQMMDGLKDSVGPDGEKQLVAIYLSLAKDLEEQMKLISSPQAKTALSKGFETFLRRVSAQSSEFNILNWVAETFRGMGEAYDDGGLQLPQEAVTYYDEALKTYDQILAKASQDATWLPSPQYKLPLQIQQANISRRLRRYPDAVNAIKAILESNEMALSVQIEAARTYQEWANDPQADPKMFELALGGGKPDEKTKKKLVWGWIRLSSLTANKEQFSDAFFESRLNIGASFYEWGLRLNGAQQREKFEKARDALINTAKLYPELGGETWRPKYDALLKNIQNRLGEKQVGLEAVAAEPTTGG